MNRTPAKLRMIKSLPSTLTLLLLTHLSFGQTQIKSCFNDVSSLVQQSSAPTAVSVQRGSFTPLVVAQNSTQSVLYEVTLSGKPSAVNLFIDATQTTIALNDNGTNGDKKAKDGIFSATIAPPKGTWTEPFVGYTRILENGAQTSQINTFIALLTSNMPVVQPKKIDNTTQYTDYIFNIIVPSTLDVPPDDQKASLNQLFYKYHADEFDFINYVLAPGYVGNRFHGNISSTAQGIGLKPSSGNPQFGSKGRLLGYNVFPVIDFYDGANNGYIHEIGHQWINQLSNTFLKDGIPHWPVSNLATAVMGFSLPGTGAGGSFPYTFIEVGDSYRLNVNPEGGPLFNQWELYLMGLISASEVTMPALLFKDQNVSVQAGGSVFPKSAFNSYTINDLIAVAGNRTPTPAQSQKRFNIANLLLSEQRLLTAEEISYFDYMARRAESQVPVPVREGLSSYMGKPFRVATGNRASLRALLNTNVNCATLPTRPTIAVSGNTTICEGSPATLTAPTNDAYIWYQNGVPLPDRTASIMVTQAGSYALSVRNASGCNSTLSNEIEFIAGAAPAKPTLTAPNGVNAYAGSAVSLQTTGGTNYRWFKDGTLIAGVQTATFSTTASGSYAVALQNAGSCFSQRSDPITVTINSIPPKPTIGVGPNGLTSSSTSDNQWLLDGKPIANATGQTLQGSGGTGTYSVQVTINGCTSVSDGLVITANEPTVAVGLNLRHAPNPASQSARISFDLARSTAISLQLLTSQGTLVRTLANGIYAAGMHTITLDTVQLPAGLYVYRLEADWTTQSRKLVILK